MTGLGCAVVWAASMVGQGATAGASAADLPTVVLIGDSIRLGYSPSVAKALEGKARVVSPPANGGDSSNVLKNLDAWAIAPQPAVVHINAGLHDLKVDRKTGKHQVEIGLYRENLKSILGQISSKTGARILLATTTPVIEERCNKGPNKAFDRRQADVDAYNKAALEVAATVPGVEIDDLHAKVVALGAETALVADGVHYTPAASSALGAAVAAAITAALEDEPPVTREATCRWAKTAPVIDGKLDDPVWADAEVIDRFSAYWSKTNVGDGTKARLLWDDEGLYYAATMTDKELFAVGTKHNDEIWNGDVFELFFKARVDKPEYHEFEVNPKSLILELPIPGRPFNFAKLVKLPPAGLKAVAVVDGTLNQPGDVDKGWQVEGMIPWSAFAISGGKPKPGAVWTFALCRYDYGPAGTEPVTMSSAPLTTGSFHNYEDYGKLTFEGPAQK